MDYFQRLIARAHAQPAKHAENKTVFDPFEQFEMDTMTAHDDDTVKHLNILNDVKIQPESKVNTNTIKPTKNNHEALVADALHSNLEQQQIQPTPMHDAEVLKPILSDAHSEIMKLQPEESALLNTADQFMAGLGLDYLKPQHAHDVEHVLKTNHNHDGHIENNSTPIKQHVATLMPTDSRINQPNNKVMHEKDLSAHQSNFFNQSNKKHDAAHEPMQDSKKIGQTKSQVVVERIIEKHIVFNHGGKTWNDVIQNSHSTSFGAGQL